MLANIIIMALIIGYCAYLIYDMVKKIKTGGIRGCAGGCACSNMICFGSILWQK